MSKYDPESHLSEGDVSLDSLTEPLVVRIHTKASKTSLLQRSICVPGKDRD